VTKTVRSSTGAIHPGESVVVTGASSTSGTVTAEAIRVGAGGATASLAGLFGGRGSSGGGSGNGAGGGGGGQTLFGPG
jgi:hypothetical protein